MIGIVPEEERRLGASPSFLGASRGFLRGAPAVLGEGSKRSPLVAVASWAHRHRDDPRPRSVPLRASVPRRSTAVLPRVASVRRPRAAMRPRRSPTAMATPRGASSTMRRPSAPRERRLVHERRSRRRRGEEASRRAEEPRRSAQEVPPSSKDRPRSSEQAPRRQMAAVSPRRRRRIGPTRNLLEHVRSRAPRSEDAPGSRIERLRRGPIGGTR